MEFSVWKEIIVIKNKSREWRCACDSVGCYNLSISGKQALTKVNAPPKRQKINLYLITPEDLGFEDTVSYEDFLEKAFQIGLGYCPEFCAPEFCVQNYDLDDNTYVYVVMEALEGHEGGLVTFLLEDISGKKILSAVDVTESTMCFPAQKFLFSDIPCPVTT